jgi:hypothetical protein
MAKNRKQKRGKSGDPSRRSGSGSQAKGKHSGADPQLRGLFKLTEELIAAAREAVRDSDEGELALFDTTQLVRSVNALKACSLLLATSHWASASGTSRQLFEQLVNLEYLAQRPDRLASVRSYAAYGLIQRIRLQLTEMEHLEQTGRPFDPKHREFLEGLLQANFDEFKGKPKVDGTINFNTSWSGLPVRQLAERSSNAMRSQQYEAVVGRGACRADVRARLPLSLTRNLACRPITRRRAQDRTRDRCDIEPFSRSVDDAAACSSSGPSPKSRVVGSDKGRARGHRGSDRL